MRRQSSEEKQNRLLLKTFGRRWNLGVPTLWKLCFKLVSLCLHWLVLGDGDVIELFVESVEGDDSIFIDSDVVDVGGVGGVCCTCWRAESVPLLVALELTIDGSCLAAEYEWSLILLQAMDCVDGWVVRTVSFWETVDVLRWCRWIWCWAGGGVGTEETGLSSEVFPPVNAAILESTSFFAKVGEEQGLTDGVLLAEMVLLLIRKSQYLSWWEEAKGIWSYVILV